MATLCEESPEREGSSHSPRLLSKGAHAGSLGRLGQEDRAPGVRYCVGVPGFELEMLSLLCIIFFTFLLSSEDPELWPVSRALWPVFRSLGFRLLTVTHELSSP